MSYSGSVTCRYCYNSGHNKRTCPKLKKYVADNPNSYTAEKVGQMQARGKIRTCTYCSQQGHNKATCDKLSNDRIAAILRNKAFRLETLESFKKLGIGLGTLFRRKPSQWEGTEDHILMCEEIAWDNILPDRSYASILVNDCSERDPQHDMSVNEYFFLMLKNGALIIEMPASPDNIGVGIPDNWASGVSNIVAIFPD